MRDKLRVVIADDERPARSVLASILRGFDDVEIVGEARNGTEAVEIIESVRPDLALVDLQMPEIDGLGVIRLVRKNRMPLVAFVTAYDEYAIQAFELNAVDYLLKPVEPARLRETINRATDRLERADLDVEARHLRSAASAYEATSASPLRRIPVRKRTEIILVDVEKVASVVADGELLHLTTLTGEKHTITHRLKDLELRLDPQKFIRLSRGTIVNQSVISKVTPMPGGTYRLTLANGQHVHASRFHSRILRQRLLRL